MDVGGLQSDGCEAIWLGPLSSYQRLAPLTGCLCCLGLPGRVQRLLRRLYRYTMCSLTTRHCWDSCGLFLPSGKNGCNRPAPKLCMRKAGLSVYLGLPRPDIHPAGWCARLPAAQAFGSFVKLEERQWGFVARDTPRCAHRLRPGSPWDVSGENHCS